MNSILYYDVHIILNDLGTAMVISPLL